ncbi:GDP-L-fucose synthase family protein [Methanolacinia petrolearia]|nr:GDP-L-fucose synthase [Methanolacinia petrolearia]
MDKESNIYVAGHKGLLGSALIKKLHSEGYTNIIFKNHDQLDLTNQNAVDDFFKNETPEYVFLAAGLTGGILANKTYPATFLHTNIAIQDNVFQAAVKYDVKNLVFYASSCIYPKECSQPIKEDYLQSGIIEETSEGYAIAKTAGVIGCRTYNRQYNSNRFIALLPNSMYGPNDNFDLENSHVLSALIRKIHDAKNNNDQDITLWGSGNPRREFIYCEDVANASIFAMKNSEILQNRHYNIGTGVDYSIKELAEIISEIIGYNGQIKWDTTKPDGVKQKLLDITEFLNLGWEPRVEIRDGIKNTYDWYLQNINNKGY